MSSEFELNKYVVVRNVLGKQSQLFFFEFIKFMAERYNLIKVTLPHLYEKNIIGHSSIADHFVMNDCKSRSYSRYGDPFTETLLLTMKEDLERETGLELLPTYSYLRLYTKGDELLIHTDRKSCEISASLSVGYVGNELWPIFMEGRPLYLEAGDMVIYRGCEVPHWRNPLEGEIQAQIFLHYNDKNGPHGEDNLYDGRTFLGLPQSNSWMAE